MPAHPLPKYMCCNTAVDATSTLWAPLSPAGCVSGGEGCDWHHRIAQKIAVCCRGRLKYQHQPSPSTRSTAPGKAAHQHAEGCLSWGCAAPPSSPTQHKAQQAHELLSLCGDLYSLQQPLHTLLMPPSVPRTDPASSQGQGPLIMHCELAQTGWTQKWNNLPLGEWSSALKTKQLEETWAYKILLLHSPWINGEALTRAAISISPWNVIHFPKGKHSRSMVQERKRGPFPYLPATPRACLSEPKKSM